MAERGVKYIEHDVSVDRKAANEMMKLTGQMGVPVIVVDRQSIIGFDRPRLEALLEKGTRSKGIRFGIKIADAGKLAQKSGMIPVFGALVGAVASGSLGEKAGLEPGDIITEVNIRRINNAADFENALVSLAPGNRMSLELLRRQETILKEIVI